MHQIFYNNKLEYKCILTPLDPRPLYVGPHILRDTCQDSYSCLYVLCVLCLAACDAAGHLSCTMQCQAASNAHYVVLGSFQHALLSFSHSTHRICTILQPYSTKLYSTIIHLGYQIITFDFYTLKL